MSLLFVGLFGCAGGGRRAGQCRRVVRNGRRGLVVALSSSGVDGNGTAGGLSGKVEVLNVSNVDGREEKYVTVRARHILLETEEMADACLEQIEEKPEAFEEIAKSLSQCPSNARGGDLGWFPRKVMVPEFEETCFKSDIGKATKLKTPFGWHVIRVDGKGTVPVDISVEEFGRRYRDPEERKQLQLIDVRERKEVEKLCLDDFYQLPVSEHGKLGDELEDGSLGFDAEKETVVICQSGTRSAHIARFLAQQGFSRVRNLVGGLDRYARDIDPSLLDS